VRAELVPAAWSAKVDALVAAGDSARAIELLKMWMTQHALTPWVMERLGRLLLAAGRAHEAGRPLFWSGAREAGPVTDAVAEFVRHKRGEPRRLAETLPRRACVPLEDMPPALRCELQALGVTEAMFRRVARQPRIPVRLAWLAVWLVVAALIGAFGVGAFVCLRNLVEWIRGLWQCAPSRPRVALEPLQDRHRLGVAVATHRRLGPQVRAEPRPVGMAEQRAEIGGIEVHAALAGALAARHAEERRRDRRGDAAGAAAGTAGEVHARGMLVHPGRRCTGEGRRRSRHRRPRHRPTFFGPFV